MTPSELRANALFETLNASEYVDHGYRRLATDLNISGRVARHLARRLKDAPVHTAEDEASRYVVLSDGRYLFEWADGEARRSAILSEEEMQSMLRAYTKDGDNQSMQVVAIRHGLSRRDFEKIKTLYGVTKDHEPFTLRELEERDIDDLAEDHLTMKRRKLMGVVENEDYRRTQAAARKWYQLQDQVLDPFAGLLASTLGSDAASRPTPDALSKDWPEENTGYIAMYQGSDLHYGLFVSDGGYDREQAKFRFHRGLRETIEHGEAAYGEMDYLLLYVGGDIAHVDNMAGATTSMRHHQDMDGTPDTLIQELAEMYLAAVDWLLAHGIRVRIACVPGNHDELISRAIATILWATYRGNPSVSFGNLTGPYSYELYGRNALIGHHGHGEKTASALGANLSNWLRNRSESRPHLYAITGNLHHLVMKEDDGCILIQQPSPAPADRYHAQNGYDRSRRATVGLYFGHETGLLGMHYIGF